MGTGIDLFENRHEEFDKFRPELSKVSKIFTLMGSFWTKYILFELKKKYWGICFMTLESDAKFEENVTCGLENDMRNLANFRHSIQKSQNWDFDGILLYKVEN